MIKAVFRTGMFLLSVIALAHCTSRSSTYGESETLVCKDKCMIVFRPDSTIIKRLLDTDHDASFTETMSDHLHYTGELQKILAPTDIRYTMSTARFITVDNGRKQVKFDARDKDGFPFGVILSKPAAEPMIQFGIFTELDYQEMIQTYFK